MFKEKIVNVDAICKFLWNQIYRKLEEKWKTVMWLAEQLNKSQPYISDLLNGKRNTSNLDIYKKMALTIWITESEFEELFKQAKKYEYEVTTWDTISDPADMLKNLSLSDLRLALSREFGTQDEAVLNDIIAYARFKIEQGNTKFLKDILDK